MRAGLGTLFLIVFIDLVGFGMIIPFLALYAETYHPHWLWFAVFTAAYSIMQFLCAPLLGRISDRAGRRPVLLLSLLGAAAGLAAAAGVIARRLLWSLKATG